MPKLTESEQKAVAQAREGSADAWDQLFKRYQTPLYAYVRECVHDDQASMDIVQETFLRAIRHLASLRNDSSFGGWLFTIAHQQCAQWWRRHAHLTTFTLDADEGVGDEDQDLDGTPDQILIREEEKAAFLKLLEQLTPEHRSVLLLHFLEDFSLNEIAQITQSKLGTVKSRLHYAKSALRQLITEKL